MARLSNSWRRLAGWITWKRLWAALPRVGIAVLVSAFIAFVVFISVAYFTGVFPDPDWTGFGPPKVNADGQEIAHFKTLWDWMGLLLVPAVLGIGGYFLTRSENNQARKREAERAQDAALQAYLDQMTQLLLENHLRMSKPDDEVRSVARARTLTVLRVLDGVRKATVMQFLYEARLIGGVKGEEGDVYQKIDAIVSLEGANLEGARLDWANLGEANLARADLKGASLARAHLEGASLTRADLKGASLARAHLEGASLTRADLKGASLTRAHLKGANLLAAYLVGANLFQAYLVGANLEGALLDWANLGEADLQGAHLAGANLEGANLKGANLKGANLTECKVTRKQLAQAWLLEGAKLPFDMTPSLAPEVEVSTPKEQVTEVRETKPDEAKLTATTMPDGSKHE